MIDYEVEDGDCLASIAESHGFFWETLWELPENADLRKLRGEPTVLAKGDVVKIPDLRQKTVDGRTEARHRFKLKGVPALLRLRLVLPDDDEPDPPGDPPDAEQAVVTYDDPVAKKPKPDRPWKNVAFTIDVDGDVQKGTTDADGRLEVKIPPTAQRGILVVEPDTPRKRRFVLDLGHLDPAATAAGAADRLNNLGYGDGSRPGEGSPAVQEWIARFQRDNGMKSTGDLDKATQDKLRELHGS